VRRKFYELAGSSLVAADVLRRIASLYAIEDEIRSLSADERRRICEQRSRPIIDDSHRIFEGRGRQVSSKSRLDKAIHYTLPRWNGLVRFLDDGRIDLANKAVERAIRPLGLNRKNVLFAGSDEGGDNWAAIVAQIENCRFTGINPHIWLTATLIGLANGHPAPHRRAPAARQSGPRTPLTIMQPQPS
jgi:hypothetical protein